MRSVQRFTGNWSAVAVAVALAFAAVGCGGSIHTQIEKALVFEQQVHTYQQQLMTVAQAAIVVLPADKQASAQAALADANQKLTLALDAKDAALQAALDASDTTNLNLSQLIADIVTAVQDVIVVANSFGANPQQLGEISQRLLVAHTRGIR